MSQTSNILNETHLAKIQDAMAQLKTAQQELALAKRAGLSSTIGGQTLPELETKINDLQARLQQVKNVYFPNAG